jgi:hypothetical protein
MITRSRQAEDDVVDGSDPVPVPVPDPVPVTVVFVQVFAVAS